MANNKNKYWRERIEAEQKAKIERDATLASEMDRLYSYHFNELEKEIRAFYERYSNKNGLPVAEVKKRVEDMDVKAFEEKAKRYVEEKDFSAQANRELGLYNLKMKVNRLELLQYNMDLEMLALSENEHKMTERFLNDEYTQEVETQAGLLGKSTLDAGEIGNAAQAIINTNFKGANWSSKLWDRQNALRGIVAETMEKLLLRGENPTKAIPKLRKEFGVSANQAKRLAVTEGARVATEAQRLSFEKYGYDEYEFISEPGACDICRPLNGKIFKVKDMVPGENAAPTHPFCRCSVAAHFSMSDDEYEKILKESKEAMTYDGSSMSRMYRNKDKNKRRPVNIARQNKLTKAFRKRGGVVYQSKESDEYLRKNGIAALNYDEKTIVLPTKPTISEILEELYHAEQWRSGALVDDPLVKIKAEIEAQKYLLSVEKKYNIPRSETEQTKLNLEYWEKELKKYEDKGY